MIYYILILHVAWGIYAAGRSTTLNEKTTGYKELIAAFLINTTIAPIGMIVASVVEWEDAKSLQDIFKKK